MRPGKSLVNGRNLATQQLGNPAGLHPVHITEMDDPLARLGEQRDALPELFGAILLEAGRRRVAAFPLGLERNENILIKQDGLAAPPAAQIDGLVATHPQSPTKHMVFVLEVDLLGDGGGADILITVFRRSRN